MARTFASVLAASLLIMGPASAGTSEAAVQTFASIVERQPRGPSFDCALPHLTNVERHICSDPALAHLDLQLNDAYGEDVFTSDTDAIGIVAAQTAWLSVRNACTTKACLRSAYEQRLASVTTEQKKNGKAYRGRDAPIHASAALTAQLAKIAGACVKVDGAVDVGDGRRSLFVRACNECADNGGSYIFHPEAGTYRILLHLQECYVSDIFEGFQIPRSHGFRRVVVFSRNTAIDHTEVFYDYDGQIYRPTFELNQVSLDSHQLTTLTRTSP